ncbi:MAG: hypothetical protein EXQ56_04830 [Acidobacteria bacterium]|nr:hypothetical protein [Acidobacteriota bacterium]
MKYFFGKKFPQSGDILIIESGAPQISDRACRSLRRLYPNAPYHLATCWPDRASPAFAQVYAVGDYLGRSAKIGLLRKFRRHGYTVLVILCTGEAVMSLWRTLALALIPAKVIIVNENADFFWLSWENRGTLKAFLGARWGVNLRHGAAILLRAVAFPFTVLFLMLTAFFYYLRRWRNLLWWKLT